MRAGTVRDPATGALTTNTPIPTLTPAATPAPTALVLRSAKSAVATSAVCHHLAPLLVIAPVLQRRACCRYTGAPQVLAADGSRKTHYCEDILQVWHAVYWAPEWAPKAVKGLCWQHTSANG